MAAHWARAKATIRLLSQSASANYFSSASHSVPPPFSFPPQLRYPGIRQLPGGSVPLLGKPEIEVPGRHLVQSRWKASSSQSASDAKQGYKVVGVFYPAGQNAHKDPKFVGNVERGLDLKDWLREQGHEYILTHDKDGENSELDKHLEDADILITTPFHPAYVTADRIKRAKKLKLLITAGVGSDHVDIRAAAEAGLVVAEITGSNVVSVAEDELLRVLLLVRNFLPAWKQVAEGGWDVGAVVQDSHDVEGKTIATVGAGRIGFELLKRLKPFNANLIYYDRVEWDKTREELTGAVRETDLDTLLAKADVLVLNLPLTHQTRELFDKEKLSKLKKGAVIVNNARGALVDANAVVELIKSGHLAGYSGDVWSQQPPPKDHPWRLFQGYDRLALTPHMSGATLDAQTRFAAGTKDILQRWFSGQELLAKDYIVKDGKIAPQYQ